MVAFSQLRYTLAFSLLDAWTVEDQRKPGKKALDHACCAITFVTMAIDKTSRGNTACAVELAGLADIHSTEAVCNLQVK